ncbi:protein translocase subunit SecD [Yinghuangia sp. ASG 101]|uniref:protein translocase subunit SecD n=1 Tax=Yinghuangia sp. ASG 101 TaxID=2896848 RepID=UPI001E4F6ADE|nr:protein translocase subunit SecD [Yinghuangia sp. ASG 101]UGQ13268.1 protein translocase subunit SecD [Yinghuangia sp. ASG 101]
MSRAITVRAVLALSVVLVSLYVALTESPRLGLDLRGGTHLVLETRDSPTAKADAEATDRTLEVLRRRVDALGVAEPTLARSGERRVIVELPDVQDPREAVAVLGRTAQLTFHPVLGVAADHQAPAGPPAAGERVLPDASGERLRLGAPALTGAEVSGAKARLDSQGFGGWYVSLDLRGDGGGRWARLTGEAACAAPGDPARRVAIVLDDRVVSSPQVDPSVRCGTGITGGSTQITGGFDRGEARELALLINGGALPVPVELIEQRTVGPTLGQEAIDASTTAAVIGIVLTSLFIVFVYRLLGALAAVALACYGLISYAALLVVGATLTLPGLAGFVLAIGMAVDANVLVFERAREEYAARRRGRSLRVAYTAGSRNAFGAILDANITTLIAAGLLYWLASGPVRGFGVTLSIGVLASMVSALVITRVLADIAVRRRAVAARPQVTGIAGPGRFRTWITARGPDLMRYRRRWLAASAVVLVVAVSGIVLRGLNLGIEFTGGRVVEYATSTPVDAETARSALSDAGHPRAVVQTSGDGNLSVRVGELTDAEETGIRAALTALGGPTEKIADDMIGPTLGDELRRNALIALGVAVAAQLVYLAVRFRWTFGAATVVAMAHDVLILVGVFAWLGKPVDGIFLAALLTVIGYSVNDSVVLFDRVRELWAKSPRTPFATLANRAILQTLPRTVNTGMGALFILVSLWALGGDSLADFALALIIGIVVGTYSSILTAAPVAISLQSRSTKGAPARRTGPARNGRRGERADNGARV